MKSLQVIIGGTMVNPDWFSPTSLTSFGGASLAVNVLVNTLRKLVTKKWSTATTRRVGFAICFLIAGCAVMLQSPMDLMSWFLLMPLNACLLFCTALGMNELCEKTTKRNIKGIVEESGFFESWIK